MTRTMMTVAALFALGCTTAPVPTCYEQTYPDAPCGEGEGSAYAWQDEGGTWWWSECDDTERTVEACDATGRPSVCSRNTPFCAEPGGPVVCGDGSAPRCVPVVCPEL